MTLTWAVTLHYRNTIKGPPDLVVLMVAESKEDAMRDAAVLVNHGRRRLDWKPLDARRVNAFSGDERAALG